MRSFRLSIWRTRRDQPPSDRRSRRGVLNADVVTSFSPFLFGSLIDFLKFREQPIVQALSCVPFGIHQVMLFEAVAFVPVKRLLVAIESNDIFEFAIHDC